MVRAVLQGSSEQISDGHRTSKRGEGSEGWAGNLHMQNGMRRRSEAKQRLRRGSREVPYGEAPVSSDPRRNASFAMVERDLRARFKHAERSD